MTLKQLTKTVAKRLINSYKVKTSEDVTVLTLTTDLDMYDYTKTIKDTQKRLIASFVSGSFIHYSTDNLQGKNIYAFYTNLGLNISTSKDNITVMQSEDFKLKNTIKNLAILSHLSGVKIGKGLLLKFADVHYVIRHLDFILEEARKIKTLMEK